MNDTYLLKSLQAINFKKKILKKNRTYNVNLNFFYFYFVFKTVNSNYLNG